MTESQDPTKSTEPKEIQCPICGNKFRIGLKTACQHCVLHHSNCGFEKCPNCGFDVPCTSQIWELAVAIKKKWQEYSAHGRKTDT